MLRFVLSRMESNDSGTLGILTSRGFSIYMMELPWRDNIKQKSCIPAGVYECQFVKSPKFGWCYQVKDVPNRKHILIHSGNFAGDVDKGYKSNSYGCLLPALRVGTLGGQKAGLLSKIAVDKLHSYCMQQPFLLEIRNDYDDLSTFE